MRKSPLKIRFFCFTEPTLTKICPGLPLHELKTVTQSDNIAILLVDFLKNFHQNKGDLLQRVNEIQIMAIGDDFLQWVSENHMNIETKQNALAAVNVYAREHSEDMEFWNRMQKENHKDNFRIVCGISVNAALRKNKLEKITLCLNQEDRKSIQNMLQENYKNLSFFCPGWVLREDLFGQCANDTLQVETYHRTTGRSVISYKHQEQDVSDLQADEHGFMHGQFFIPFVVSARLSSCVMEMRNNSLQLPPILNLFLSQNIQKEAMNQFKELLSNLTSLSQGEMLSPNLNKFVAPVSFGGARIQKNL